MDFRETGNKIPISSDELINYAQTLLADFDTKISTNKSIPSVNPYVQPLIYKTNDGKTIRIPDEIQKQAVHIWYQKTGRNVPVMQQINQDYKEAPTIDQKQKVVYVYENSDNYINIGILIIAAVLALFLLFKITGNTGHRSFNITSEQIRYYLTNK
jgi:hypothetical protein